MHPRPTGYTPRVPLHALPEVSEPSTVAVDPCAAARCSEQAETDVPLRIGGRVLPVRLCGVHAARRAREAGTP